MKSPLVIHGHFYQPPRENPWTHAVEREPSAHPFHDWNERIHHECYRANAFARIYDDFGRIESIRNNYDRISFNFGPTLLSWLEQNDPVAYARVLEADRTSVAKNRGHGNAIAQGYNHAILPLCNERDRRTQVRWGIADFRHRFGRAPESLWLPETACNDATLGTLIEEGLRYVILSPHQAERVRRVGAADWSDVSNGSIDPGRAYVYRHRDGSDRTIAIFFYDGHISRAIAFEGGLASSQGFIKRFRQARGSEGRLVHVATDGESYGHHTRHGERGLAHALVHEAAAQGFELTNYGAYLDDHPPEVEVEIKPGKGGEGTAWSCAHGVGRWYRDCGCNTGAREGWNQAWRGPLRRALDVVRDAAASAFEETRGTLFVDPWAARDAFVEMVLSPSGARGEWLERHAGKTLRGQARDQAFTHLELQHAAQLMYTSCGWFFADISGIETVQIMKYAQRALDLAEELDLDSPRERFLEVLSEAKSNLREMGNGADVFHRFVDPLRLFPARVVAHVAISSLVDDSAAEGSAAGYRFKSSSFKKQRHGRLIMSTAHIELEERTTEKHHAFGVAAMHFGGVDFYCVARPFGGAHQFAAATTKLWANFRTASLPVMLRIAQEELGPDEFGLESVLPEGRQRIGALVFGDIVGRFAGEYAHLYESNQRVLDMLQDAGFELPQEMKMAAEFAFSRRLEAAIRQADGSLDANAYAASFNIAAEAAGRGYKIDYSTTRPLFARAFSGAVARALAEPTGSGTEAVCALAALAKQLGLGSSLEVAQELFYASMQRGELPRGLYPLGKELGFAVPDSAPATAGRTPSTESA